MAIARLFDGLISPELLESASRGMKRGLFEFGDVPTELRKPEIIGGQTGLMNYAMRATEDELDAMDTNMKLARDMFKRGASFEDQVARTGMGYGPDDKLRFEIPDTGAKMNIPVDMLEEGEVYRVKDLLSHPRLYDFYPDLENKAIRVVKDEKNPQSFGAYNYDSQTIDLNIGSVPFIDKEPVEVVSNLLHEVQHYTQQIEKFMKGSSAKRFLKQYTNKPWNMASEVDKQKAVEDYLKTYGEAEARNVSLRFKDPIYAKYGSSSKTKDKNFVQTMGQDEDTLARFKRPLGPTEFIDNTGEPVDARLDYTNPFPSSIGE